MADVETTLKTLLASASGSPAVYALVKPVEGTFPCFVYTRINRRTHISQSGDVLMYEDHYQIASLAETYQAMRALDGAAETLLTANTSGWVLSVPTGSPLAPPDNREEKVRMTTRDYIIWSRP